MDPHARARPGLHLLLLLAAASMPRELRSTSPEEETARSGWPAPAATTDSGAALAAAEDHRLRANRSVRAVVLDLELRAEIPAQEPVGFSPTGACAALLDTADFDAHAPPGDDEDRLLG